MTPKDATQLNEVVTDLIEKVKLQISTSWQTSRNGAEFRFLASGCRTVVLPPSKKRKVPKGDLDSMSKSPFIMLIVIFFNIIRSVILP